MTHEEPGNPPSDFNRRDFLRGASFGTLMTLMGGIPIIAGAQSKDGGGDDTGFKTVSAPVYCGVIGCGPWGREILQTLAILPNAPIVAICETYEPFLNRAKGIAPKAAPYSDYKKVLEDKAVEAVIIATPSHQHKDLVLAALQAGKHVYCEAPLAASPEDSKAIAQAARAAIRVNFQPGLQWRAHPRIHYIYSDFIHTDAVGTFLMARASWHQKLSWRRPAPDPEREREYNWRLSQATSPGLIGEVGIHQLDRMNWFFGERPAAVTGFGGILNWKDGRDVPDTVQAVLEYPCKANFHYDATLGNSFEEECDVIYGANSAIMVRGDKGWIFKEVDSPLLGWEVFGAKEQFYKDTGFILSADATKSVTKAKVEISPYDDTPLNFALKAFVQNCHVTRTGVRDYLDANPDGGDAAGIAEHLASLAKGRFPAAGYREGFEATICALKANEAAVQGRKIAFQKEWFDI